MLLAHLQHALLQPHASLDKAPLQQRQMPQYSSMRNIGGQLRKMLPSHTSFTVEMRSGMNAATSRTNQCDTCMDRGLRQSQKRNKAVMVPSHRKLPKQDWKLSSEAGRVSLDTPLTASRAWTKEIPVLRVAPDFRGLCVWSNHPSSAKDSFLAARNSLRQWREAVAS